MIFMFRDVPVFVALGFVLSLAVDLLRAYIWQGLPGTAEGFGWWVAALFNTLLIGWAMQAALAVLQRARDSYAESFIRFDAEDLFQYAYFAVLIGTALYMALVFGGWWWAFFALACLGFFAATDEFGPFWIKQALPA